MEKEFQSVSYEGGDQVGKGDAVTNLAEYFSESGMEVEVIQFPYYSTPIGYLVRDMLVNDTPDYLDIDDHRKLEIKLSLFALNRLEILNCLKCCEDRDLYLFDRGPYSCALTIAYDVSKRGNWEEKYIQNAIDIGLSYDKYFIDTLNIENCIVCLKYDGIVWEANRGEGEDLHENEDVQRLSDRIYRLIEKRVGNGWINVVTKDDMGWRSREKICKEVTSFIKRRGFVLPKGSKKRKEPNYLGIEEIGNDMYVGTVVDDELKRKWGLAIRSNNKKEVYVLAKDISEAIGRTTELVKWNDVGLRLFFKDILEELPEICYIIEHRYGKEFLVKLVRSLK